MKTSTLMSIRSDCAELRCLAARLKIVNQELRQVFEHLDRQLTDVPPCTDVERAMIELARLKPAMYRADEISGTAATLGDLCHNLLAIQDVETTAAEMQRDLQEALA